MQIYEKLAVLGRMAVSRPGDIPALFRDRANNHRYRKNLPSHGPVEGVFSRIRLAVPNRTDLEQFEEIWVGQAYGMREDFVPKPHWTVVDVGANVGCFSLWAAAHMKKGRIWAFEPVPATFSYLQQNIVGNRQRWPLVQIQAHSYAVTDTSGTLSMLIVAESTGWNRLIAEEVMARETRPVIQVPAKPLDSLLPETPVDLLKVDVEGAELQVLRGAARTLLGTTRVVMEYHSADLLRESWQLLETAGFRLILVTEGPNIGAAYFRR